MSSKNTFKFKKEKEKKSHNHNTTIEQPLHTHLPSSSTFWRAKTTKQREILGKSVVRHKTAVTTGSWGFQDSKGQREVNERHDALEQRTRSDVHTDTHRLDVCRAKLSGQTQSSSLNQNFWQELKTSAPEDLTTGSPWETAEDSSSETILLFIYLCVSVCVCAWCVLLCLWGWQLCKGY